MFGCIFNAILYYALAPKSVISHEKFNNVWPTVEVRSLNTFTVGMNVMNAFELFFFQVGKMVQHTSLMTLKNKLRAQVWICFAFSLIDAGSQLYKQAQILTKIYWSLLISGAECSTVFFDLTTPRPLNFSLVIMIDYNWECRSPCGSASGYMFFCYCFSPLSLSFVSACLGGTHYGFPPLVHTPGLINHLLLVNLVSWPLPQPVAHGFLSVDRW